ncbi:MAG: hypothetical protein GX446_01425 [Chthonomonadales bacterium]|nr:hypothetical protein [Chthonomonadales bacterium]
METGTSEHAVVRKAAAPRWFWWCAGLLLCLDVWVVGQDVLSRAAIADRVRPARTSGLPFDIEGRADRDPALAAVLPSAGAGRRIRQTEPPSDSGYILIALSSCTSCTKLDVRRWVSDARGAGVRLLAVSASPSADIAAFRKAIAKAFPVYRDPQGALHESLNAWWNGRIYYFDSRWRLRWMASFPESDRNLASLDGLRAAIRQAHPAERPDPERDEGTSR